MWKLTAFFFRLNFWKGARFTLFSIFGMILIDRLIPDSQEKDFILSTACVCSSLFFSAFFGISGVSSNLSWIHALPLKRRNIFLIDYATRILGIIQMTLFHLVPMILSYVYLAKNETFRTSLITTLEKIQTSKVHSSNFQSLGFFLTPDVLVFLFSGISLFHLIAMASPGRLTSGHPSSLENSRRIQAKGFLSYFLERTPIEKFCSISFLLMLTPFIFNSFFPNSPYLMYGALIQGLLITFAIANVQKFKLMPSSLQKFFSAHIVAALIFITVPGALAYQQFKKGTAQQKIDSILFLGELAPKLDSKTITTLFFAKNESINFSELKTVLDYQKIPQTVFSLDKDWLLFSNLMKTLKSADDITFALSFFSSKAMTEAQVTLLIGEYSRVRKGIPWTTDFMTLVQYPQSLDTMKRFLASTRKDLNRLALHLAAFQLDSSAVPEIQRVIEKFDPFNQRFALKTLSVLEGRAFGLMDWKPAVVVQKPLKAVKGKPIREIASVPQDYRLFCENYTVPDFKHELSKDQVNGLNICVRFRARNADLRTKIMVENLSWFENTPVDSDDIQFIKSVFSKSKEPS